MRTYYITLILVFTISLYAQFIGEKRPNGKIKPNVYFALVVSLILIGVSAFRWRVGTDYMSYVWGFTNPASELRATFLTFSEPGFKLLVRIAAHAYDDYVSMFLISAVVTIGLIAWTIYKYSPSYSFSLLLYILIGTWHGSFNGIRQHLAVAVIFAGHKYIIERNFRKYLLIVLLAYSFHASGAVMLLLYFVPTKKINLNYIVLLFLTSIVVLYSYEAVFSAFEVLRGEPLINPRTMAYFQRQVNILRILTAFMPVILYFLLEKKTKISASLAFYFNITFVNAAFWLATSQSAYLARIGIYTNIFLTLSYPRLTDIKDRRVVNLLRGFILLFYLIFWYIDVSSSIALNDFQWIFNR